MHLAQHGYTDEALRVAEGLLAVVPVREGESVPSGGEDSNKDSSPQGATVRPNLWTYEQILKTKIPTLVEAAGLPGLRFLCGLLARSLQLSRSSDEDDAADHSYIWRRAIEDHSQNQEQGLDSLLVGAIRDAAEKIARKGRTEVLEVVAQLKDLGRPIFRRIELYVLARFKNEASGLVAERLTDRGLFDGAEYRHEYSILLGEAFDILSPDQQKTIFAWIEEGFDVKEIQNPEEVQRYVRSWQMKRLYWLKGHLSEPWSGRYQKLIEEFGEPAESAKFSVFMQEFVDSRSPVSAEELKALPVAKIVERLKSWEPSAGFMMPSREGLAERLATAVTEEPGRFVADIDSFRGVHPTYVRFLIQALQNVLAKGESDWFFRNPALSQVDRGSACGTQEKSR